MAFTDQQLIDLRRFMGYEMYGNSATPVTGYRFFGWNGTVEYRLANATANEQSVVVSTYLTPLYTLEQAITAAGATLNVASAGPFTRNKNEIADRLELFTIWRKKLCAFFGVPPGRGVTDDDGSVAILP